MHAFVEAQGEAVLQELARRIKQEDGKHLEVDDAGDQVGHALQQLIEVENRGELAADLGEQRELAGLPRHAGIEASVLDADGDARGEERKQALVLFVESAGLGGLDVEYADDLVLGNEWDGQLGVNTGSVVDGILLSGQVVDQHGFAALHGLSGDALADLDADALGDLRRVPDLEANAQVLGFFVQQQNGKNFVVDDALEHLGHTLQQRVKVQRGVHRVGDFEQIAVADARNRLWIVCGHHPNAQQT